MEREGVRDAIELYTILLNQVIDQRQTLCNVRECVCVCL